MQGTLCECWPHVNKTASQHFVTFSCTYARQNKLSAQWLLCNKMISLVCMIILLERHIQDVMSLYRQCKTQSNPYTAGT